MKVHSIIAASLKQSGVDVVFGLMGDSNMQFITDFVRDEGGRFISSVHEGGAVGMADGYSRLGNRVGVASVTHGPGTTNTLTALTEAVRARSAVLVFSADTPPVREDLQSANLSAIAAAAGADYWPVLAPDHVAEDIAMLVAKVAVTKRPILVNIPAALLRVEIEGLPSAARELPLQALSPDQSVLERAVSLVRAADRPIIVAGRGAVLAEAHDALVSLGEAIGAPLSTTLLGREYFAADEFNLGVFGGLSHAVALDAIAQSDCVITFGAILNPWTTDNRGHFAGKIVIQVTNEPGAVGRYTDVDLAVIGDARIVAERMREALGDRPNAGHLRTPALQLALDSRDPSSEFTDVSNETTVDMRTAMLRLNDLLPRDRAVVTDSGRFKVAPWRYLQVSDPLAFTHTTNFGSIGLGLSTAIGGALARPELITVCVTGDGGAMMNLMEFSTAVREGIPFVLVVLDDGSYGTEWTKLKDFGIDPDYSLMTWPDFASMARAFGGDGVTVHSLDELDALAGSWDSLARPLLIDIKADPTVDVGML